MLFYNCYLKSTSSRTPRINVGNQSGPYIAKHAPAASLIPIFGELCRNTLVREIPILNPSNCWYSWAE